MDIGRADVLMYAYTVGVLLSGVLLQRQLPDEDPVVVAVLGFVLAAVWMVYYHFIVEPRAEKMKAEATEG